MTVTNDFIAKLAPYAVSNQIEYGVLASITIAQGILESGSGVSAPGNNLFGIKGSGTTQTTREFINGVWITVRAGFRAYPTWEGSVIDHSVFLTVNGRYRRAGFFDRCTAMDYAGAAWSLQTAGYATDPKYAAMLIRIIEMYGLAKYDTEAKELMGAIEVVAALTKRVEALEKRLTTVESTDKLMAAPVWFVKEFGKDALAGIVTEANGNAGFWRNVAVALRIEKRG